MGHSAWHALRTLVSARVWAVIGLVALAALIWLVGPLIAVGAYRPLDSVLARMVLVVLIVAVWAARVGYRHWRAAQLNAQMLSQLREPVQSRAAREEEAPHAQELKSRFDEAARLLRSARLGTAHSGAQHGQGLRGRLGRWFEGLTRQYLYQLPWYVFIGAPGSGKTTALVNSGLTFPLAEQFGKAAIRGVGGTRHCDWWFTNEAVLIDTAGRYATHESNRVLDQDEWSGFLALLKKYRVRQPLNGALLTISVSDLLGASEVERTGHAMALRKRLQELRTELGIQFPVYVLVTKADLLSGFTDYFGRLNRTERAQVWGFTISLAQTEAREFNLRAVFEREYRLLHRRLNDALPELFSAEPDARRRELIYSLPQQFIGLQEVLGQFVEQVFSSSRFDAMPLLRGVYFTSGTQEGTVFDRVMGGIKRFLKIDGVPPAPHAAAASGRSFFLKDLLQELIFKEARLAGTDLRWYQRQRMLALVCYAALALLLAGALVAWVGSYARNRAYLASVEARVPQIDRALQGVTITDADNIARVLPMLDAMRNIGHVEAVDPADAPLAYRWGLFQGDKIQSAAENVYHRALDELLLPLAARRLETAVRDAPPDDPAYVYAALKAYLMLYDSAHYDPDFVQAVLDLEIASAPGTQLTSAERRDLRAHMAALFAGRVVVSPFAQNEQMVAAAREKLMQLTFAQRLYAQLARTLRPAAVAYDVSAAQMAGPSGALVFRRASGASLNDGVPGLYTYDGYWKVFDTRLAAAVDAFGRDEVWVLGRHAPEATTPAAVSAQLKDVRSLYFDDFIRRWDDYLGDLRLQSTASLAQTTQIARVLSAPDSPLTHLANAAASETTLARSAGGGGGLAAGAQDKVNQARESLAQIFGQPQGGGDATGGDARPEAVVDAHFAGLREFGVQDAGGAGAADGSGGLAGAGGAVAANAALAAVLKSIDNLYTWLTAADAALRGGGTPPQSDSADQIRAEAGHMPAPFRQMLGDLANAAQGTVTHNVDQSLAQSASVNIGDFCRQAIAGRYPFARGSSRDVAPGDFARVFAPGGMMDDFFQKNLQSRVDTSVQPWRFIGGGASASPGSTGASDASGASGASGDSALLASFEKAAVIRDAFFAGGARTPTIKLEIKPLDMDPDISEWTLDVDGQQVRYAHGPQAPVTVQWPGPRGMNQVRLQIVEQNGATDGFVTEGPWALMRLFDRAASGRAASGRAASGRAASGSGPAPEQMVAGFNVDHHALAMQVSADSVRNPLRLAQLESFSCPGKS
ncbi:type VI secretion system membrane subunit TssM [Paraburkholderia silviterrae]|uniref:type VI secretion system membrane subunit TssM n=1 Tax=Paraburkholderia silviterrae TaxID=2528715 RepID=UPI00363EC0CE